MSAFRKPTAVLLIFLLLLVIPALACHVPLPDDAPLADRQTATAAVQPTIQAIETAEAEIEAEIEAEVEAENKAVMENPDAKLVFSYSGENQSYHTGLRNRTVFYINHDVRTALAHEEASFEEPHGCNTARGTDKVDFDGLVDEDALWGDFTITTDFTASGCEGSDRFTTVKYSMIGTLSAKLVDGQWVGTVTGTAKLKQTWSDGEGPDVDDSYPINWTIVGTPIE